MPKLIEGWRGTIVSALVRAGFFQNVSSAGYTGKITISMVDGGIKFVELAQTVK